MRLYDVDEGVIELNKINIKDYEVSKYRNYMGSVFQDYKLYAATVKENVILDMLDVENDDDVIDALEQSGFKNKLDELKSGLDTNLTTEFEKDGVDLSGGEAQKIAIARSFYKKSSLIILDAPSSALNPIAEYHLNQKRTKKVLIELEINILDLSCNN
ncbi:MAG: ABC transporter ATP-binding protein [Clostridiales bacterium]